MQKQHGFMNIFKNLYQKSKIQVSGICLEGPDKQPTRDDVGCFITSGNGYLSRIEQEDLYFLT